MPTLQRFLLIAFFLLLQACGGSDGSSTSNGSSSSAFSIPADFPQGTVSALPVLNITTEDNAPIVSKDDYLDASLTLATEGETTIEGELEIRGRGNSTWEMPKKPYRLKLKDSTSLLGMPASKHWVLLANYSDKTLMRNDITFKLSELMGMEYTPRSRHITLNLNGEYQGVYQLVEHIRIGADRVNIPELKVGDTALDKITGGYLIEIDDRRGEDFCTDSSRTGMVFCLSNPESLLETEWTAQREYIENYITDTESAIFEDNFTNPDTGYAAYIDVDSMINYYIINELFRNVDGNLRLSTFLYKKRDGKLFFGPLWDFDLAIGNVDYGNADLTEGWHIKTAPWFERLFEDPAFVNKVKTRWRSLRDAGTFESIFYYADARAQWLDNMQEDNFEKWPILNIYVWPNRVVTGSYEGEVDAMSDWLRERLEWMDTQLGQ